MISCSKEQNRPNIIYILADDLGYGELGVYGQKIIETPHIDALAKNGMRFLQHYSGSPVCAPSRSVLMTGQHSATPISVEMMNGQNGEIRGTMQPCLKILSWKDSDQSSIV